MGTLVRAVIGAALVSNAQAATVADAAWLKCTPTEKHLCDIGMPCRSIPATSWAEYRPGAAAAYSRCDDQGCQSYPAFVRRSEVFTTIELPGRATFAKIGVDGSFVEVVTLTTQVYISFGRCARV
jgi:hypothetical protein